MGKRFIQIGVLFGALLLISGCTEQKFRWPNDSVRQLAREVSLRPTETRVYFETGKANLFPGGLFDLKALALQFNSEEELLLVEGYASGIGDSLTNDGLSRSRASTVAEELAKQGVPRLSILIDGFGETLPRIPDGKEIRIMDQMVRVRVLNRETVLINGISSGFRTP